MRVFIFQLPTFEDQIKVKIEIFITIDDQISENEITHEFYQTQKGAGICKSYSKPSVERLKVKRRTNEL